MIEWSKSRMCCDYQYQDDYDDHDDLYDDPGTSSEHYEANLRKPTSEVDTDYRYVNDSKKVKVTCDKPIDGKLANLVTDWFREEIEEERYNELLKAINCPENCTALVTFKTNQMVWDFLSPMTKSSDKKMQIFRLRYLKVHVHLLNLHIYLASVIIQRYWICWEMLSNRWRYLDMLIDSCVYCVESPWSLI